MKDSFDREIDYLRISVTDRCNLRCTYCMPEEGINCMKHEDILRFEEIYKIVKVCTKVGIKKVKITGGEPLVRRGVLHLVKDIKLMDGIEQVTLTTNGVLITKYKEEILNSNLDGINISLDSLNRDTYSKITRRDNLEDVLKGIQFCLDMGIKTKINCVVMKQTNSKELVNIANLAKDKDLCVRFIELMPIGIGQQNETISNKDVFMLCEEKFGKLIPDDKKHGNGPAVYYKPKDFVGSIGFISALSNCFCKDCNRIRLTADGFLKLCLQYDSGINVKKLVRSGTSSVELAKILREQIYKKPRQHSFEDYTDKNHIECKIMSQIGG